MLKCTWPGCRGKKGGFCPCLVLAAKHKPDERRVVLNRYNRAVFYPGHIYHSGMGYFGSKPSNGRLYQILMFNIPKTRCWWLR